MSIYRGDCLEWLRTLPDNSVDAVVTDPPYGLSAPPDIAVVLRAWLDGEHYEHGSNGFMSAKWDSFVPGPLVWREVMRVLKPGGHAVVFAGTRTVDLMGMACRIAGFEARDVGRYNYYTGFPKSMDISKAIDKAAGAEREVVGEHPNPAGNKAGTHALNMGVKGMPEKAYITAPATEAARQWNGHGTALKPSGEPWLLLRKPLQERTIAGQVLATGTGSLNIDATRYPQGDLAWPGPQTGSAGTHCDNRDEHGKCRGHNNAGRSTSGETFHGPEAVVSGRFPANLYACPKASRKERERGCDSLAAVSPTEVTGRTPGSKGQNNPRAGMTGHVKRRNKHPTVKPVELMRWLCRLVTPPGGTVIDPFAGSGTTGIAAALEGFDFMGAELIDDHADIAEARIAHAHDYPEQWADTKPGRRIAKTPKPKKARKPKQQTIKGMDQ